MVNSNYSLAVGAGNSNEKDFSFTCGDGCVTQATRSQAFGLDNTAWSANSMVIGQYASGIGVTSTSHLFIVGNGNNVVRRNAFEVLTNGQVFANASPTTNNSVLRLEDIISKVSLNI